MSNDLRLRQICLAAPELAPLEEQLATVLDLHVVHRDPNLDRYGLVNVIVPIGPRFIEIVAPIEDNTAAGRFLERSGGRGGYMAIFDCADPDQRAEHAESLGIPVVNRLQHDTYTGRQLHPRHCRAAMIEFNYTDGGEQLDGPYWPAGPHWQAGPASTVTQSLEGIDLASPTAQELAAHWGRILQCEVAGAADDHRIDAGGVAVRFVHDDAARECLGALHLTVIDPAAALDRARHCGLRTSADRFQLAGVEWVLHAA